MRLMPFEYAVRNLGRSRFRAILAIGGTTLVILLFLSAAAFVRGMEKGLAISGQVHNVILLGAGSEESVERSEIDPATPGIVAAAIHGIRRQMNQPFISEQSHVQLPIRLKPDDPPTATALVRGVTPAALLVHSQVRVWLGRLPETGRNEIMVGTRAHIGLAVPEIALAVGNTLWLDDRPWTIVGRFEAPGTVMEAEIWTALSDLQEAAKRTTYSCVVLTLGEAEFADIDAFCKQRLDLQLVAMTESAYFAQLTAFFRPIRLMVWATAMLIGFGGLCGGLNIMYSAFASRVREFASLQTLGFSRSAILISLVQESIVMTSAGALMAAAVAMSCLNNVAVRFSMGVFGLLIDTRVLALGLAAGVLLGVLGAIPPGWRCLRRPIAEALRAG